MRLARALALALTLAPALALALAPPVSAAGVGLAELRVPEKTVAAKPFPVSVDVVNERDEPALVYLFGALYEKKPGEGPCGPSSDARFKGYTPLLQARIELPPHTGIHYPEGNDTWLHRYRPDDVPAQEADMELCVFVAQDATPGGAQLVYEDVAVATLHARKTNAAPTGEFRWEPPVPQATQPVHFVADGSDADGDSVTFLWDFGFFDATGRAVDEGNDVLRRFYPEGDYVVTLIVQDGFDETRYQKGIHVLPEGAGVTPPPVVTSSSETPLPALVTLAALLVAARLARR